MLTNLKMLRAKYNLNQNEMAKKGGVTRPAYSYIENGKSKGSMSFWLKLEAAFPEDDVRGLYLKAYGKEVTK